jgi:carotenoid cleavage dioxygenase
MPNPYLDGNFAPVSTERTDDHELPTDGIVPPDLDGRLLRNGPNPVVVPADPDDYDWWGGDGMVHGITLRGCKALGYANRCVRTRKLAGELGTEPPPGPAEPVDGPANHHVVRHGGVTLALGGTGLPLALSRNLERARLHDFDAMVATPVAGHPTLDPETGELVVFGVDVFGPPFLRTHVVDAGGAVTATAEVDLPRAVLVPDLGVTATRVVIPDLPVVFDLALAAAGRSFPYRWMPEAGARIGITARRGDDGVRWIGMDPSAVSHVVNAFDDGDRVVCDVVRYDSAFDLPPGGPVASRPPVLVRWTVDPATNRVMEEQLDDIPVELPRIDPAVVGRPHRFVYCQELSPLPQWWQPRGLVRYDLARGESTRFDPGPYGAASEPIFVRAADGHGEDEGWVLTVVYDASRGASDLVILDATSFAGPPVATVHLPVRVPFGFHGSWLPAGE